MNYAFNFNDCNAVPDGQKDFEHVDFRLYEKINVDDILFRVT